MAEVIQFQCPACGVLLRLPLAMGARQGPCPACQREIIAPDPRVGTSACVAAVATIPNPAEAPLPFAERPPVVPHEPAIAPLPSLPEIEIPSISQPAPLPVVTAGESPKTPAPCGGLVFFPCLLTAFVAAGIGYYAGLRNHRPTSAAPPLTPSSPVSAQAPEASPPSEPEPTEVLANSIVEPPPPVAEESPAKVSAGAEATLRAFLDAPDWVARSAYVWDRERVKSAMEAYSHEVADGPTDYKAITVKQSQTDASSGNTLFIFMVVTEDMPTGIPVAVAETSQGWLIDWQAFVEFRDDQFMKFADGPAHQTGRFHLIVTVPPPERAANTESEHFASFLVDPPFPGRQQLAFVKKNSAAFATCKEATASGGIFTPVLELTKLATTNGQGYLEILNVVAPDWRPPQN